MSFESISLKELHNNWATLVLPKASLQKHSSFIVHTLQNSAATFKDCSRLKPQVLLLAVSFEDS